MPSLEETAKLRKERLLGLRKRKEAGGDVRKEGDKAGEVFKFRNFDPETREAKKRAIDDGPSVESSTALLTAQVLADDAIKRAQDLDLTSIQPKRANWDLKRDYQRLWEDRLKGETARAMTTLIRQRLEKKQKSVTTGADGQSGMTGEELTAAVLSAEAADRREVDAS